MENVTINYPHHSKCQRAITAILYEKIPHIHQHWATGKSKIGYVFLW